MTFQIPVFATGFPTHNSSWHVIPSILVYMCYMYVLYICIIYVWPRVFSAKSCCHTAFGEKKDFSLEELTSIKCPLQVGWKPRRSEQNWVAKRYLCHIYINIILIYIWKSISHVCVCVWTLGQFKKNNLPRTPSDTWKVGKWCIFLWEYELFTC